MKFRILVDSDELIIITEDGGIVSIREAEPLSDTEPRLATTDYYQSRLTSEMTADNVWEELAEGKMYYNDWDKLPFNSWALVEDALRWLAPAEKDYEIVPDLFTDIFPLG